MSISPLVQWNHDRLGKWLKPLERVKRSGFLDTIADCASISNGWSPRCNRTLYVGLRKIGTLV